MTTFEQFLKDLKKFGLEWFGRYYATYPGVVEDTNDPTDQGRIRVSIPDLGRKGGDPLIHYAYPVSPFAGNDYGFFFPPEIGDKVWIVFDGGQMSQPFYLGGWWLSPEKTSASSFLPTEAKKNGSPTTRLIKTPVGHILLFEDDEAAADGKRIELHTSRRVGATAEALHKLVLSDKSGEEKITLETNEGHLLEMVDAAGQQKVRIHTNGDHEITMDDALQSITVRTALGHTILMDDIAQSVLMRTASGTQSIALNDLTQTTTLVGQNKLEQYSGSQTREITGNIVNQVQGSLTNQVTGAKTDEVQGAHINTVSGEKTTEVNGLWQVTLLDQFKMFVQSVLALIISGSNLIIGIPPSTIAFDVAAIVVTAGAITLAGNVVVGGSLSVLGGIINLIPGTPLALGAPTAPYSPVLTQAALAHIDAALALAAADVPPPALSTTVLPGDGLSENTTVN